MAPPRGVLDQLIEELSLQRGGGQYGLNWSGRGYQPQAGFRHDPVTQGTASGTPQGPMMHGPEGLWGVMGVERQIISTHVHGPSLAARLPAVASSAIYPYFGYLTGFQDTTGDDADWDSSCEDPPTAGAMKNCFQTAQFGQIARQTREVDISRIGELINRGEVTDLVIVNDPVYDQMANIAPTVPGQPNLRREVLVRMMELGVSFQRAMAPLVFTGDPANNQGTGYQEWPGLDVLITTAHEDAFTGQQCPSLDSTIVDMAYADASDPDAGYVNTLTYAMYYLERLARQTNLDPVEFAFVMRPELFYEITANWPCTYLTYRCIFGADADQARLNIDAAEVIRMRDAMRNGEYLIIGSKRYEVILDGYMHEQTEAEISSGGGTPTADSTCFASDVYIVPLRVAGNILSLYWEYFNFDMAMQAAADMRMANGPFWSTDGGRWLWNWKLHVNTCIQAIARIRPRILLRTPQLAMRLQNVMYCHGTQFNVRDVLPGDSFFVNGGVTGRSFTQPFSAWNPSAG